MPAPVIIVTGVSRGIGRAIALELQARSAAVVGAARNVAAVPATGGLLPVAADVTQEAGRKAILEAALARHVRQLAEPAGVARAVAFVALADSDYITGQLLAVDGGYLAQGLPGRVGRGPPPELGRFLNAGDPAGLGFRTRRSERWRP
jgi:NAD(P)-dependent dehydrogenase (short-subunit alcohol dehydrogenase family)